MRVALSAAVTLAALALPTIAHADTTDSFSVTGHGLTLTFSLPASPDPTGKMPQDYFFLGDVSFVENGVGMVANGAYFYTKPSGGGFSLQDENRDVIDDLDFFGPKLFTGPVRNPTFKIGDFKLRRGDCEVASDSAAAADTSSCQGKYTLSIAPEDPASVTPEPGSLLLMGTGALGALGTLRRRLARS